MALDSERFGCCALQLDSKVLFSFVVTFFQLESRAKVNTIMSQMEVIV